jgi:hypothetical protein
MIKILAMESAKKLNFFSPSNGMSSQFSPRMIIHKENLDYSKHCAISFGTYVQAHNKPTHSNSQQPRTLDCIYLQYLNNKQGGHEFLDIRTGATITRRNVTPLPMTQNIINIVHSMADNEKMPTGFKKLHQEMELHFLIAKMSTLKEWKMMTMKMMNMRMTTTKITILKRMTMITR